jgi:hypothetical protein
VTREQAIAIAETRWWETAGPKEIVDRQLYESKLIMDFGAYHQALESVLGRPVFTHEMAWVERLRAEYEGRKEPPDPNEVIAELMADLDGRVIVIDTRDPEAK